MFKNYKDLTVAEKAIAILIIFAVLYMVWQIAFRPFWNN